MQLNKKCITSLIKVFILFVTLELAYLFVVPYAVEKCLNSDRVKNEISAKTNNRIIYSDISAKTRFLPKIVLKANEIKILDNEGNSLLFSENFNFEVRILPLLFKKLDISEIFAQNIKINLKKDKNGIFNFESLFSSDNKDKLTPVFKNINVDINALDFSFTDDEQHKTLQVNLVPMAVNLKKHKIQFSLNGDMLVDNKYKTNLDIDLKTNYPFSKEITSDVASGHVFLSNLNLDSIQPFLQNYLDKELIKLSGQIDYFQLSALNNSKNNQIVLNTLFRNMRYSRQNWKNDIFAQNDNKLSLNSELQKNFIKLNAFHYTADNVNLKANGTFKLGKTPEIHANTEIIDSKAENIIPILPPNLVKKFNTFEKIKTYGAYGDVNANIQINGKLPKPDITGFVKARNVHMLEKAAHKLHKGTIDITFNKRTLDMDIKVDVFGNQWATIKGYTYMFREGINHITVKTSDSVDLSLAQRILLPISKVFLFQLGPIVEMDIKSGKGNTDLDIKSKIDYVNVHGDFNFRDANLSYNGLYGEVRNGKGKVNFDGDLISFNTDKAFVKSNAISLDGKVKINDYLDVNISAPYAQSRDVLEIINKSELLKDVKNGMAIITDASGFIKLLVNITANITPLPYGADPLPPEEAFTNMKVKGSVDLKNDNCFIDGFYTPLEKITGVVDFTEQVINLNNIKGVSGSSPLNLKGTVVTDINTKIPDVDIEVTSNSVNLRDTIKFLTQSYLYPKNYPDLSSFYQIGSKHDLYFKYKAKSIDFVTNNAYAVANFIPDSAPGPLKATSGKVIMKNSVVQVQNVLGTIFDSKLKVSGDVQKIDTVNPIYNLKIEADKLNLDNLNHPKQIAFIPQNIRNSLSVFQNYSGNIDADLQLNKNILSGEVSTHDIAMNLNNMPFTFDDFKLFIKNDRTFINNFTAKIGDAPIFGNVSISNISKKPFLSGYFTAKLTDNFVKNYLPKEISEKVDLVGDINLSSKFNGNLDSLSLQPILTLNPDADITYSDMSLGETTDKREFNSDIKIENGKILLKRFDYKKYVASQNNKVYPITFSSMTGDFIVDKNNMLIPRYLTLKTDKNISAKLLNLFLNKPIFNQGTLNCDLKYYYDPTTGASKLLGNMDSKNLNIPLFDSNIKEIKVHGQNDSIIVNMFGFMEDSKVKLESVLKNQIIGKPKISSINIEADYIENNILLEKLSGAHQLLTSKDNKKSSSAFEGFSIDKGHLSIKKLVIKNMKADDFETDFSVDEAGIFSADNLKINIGQGSMTGSLSYNFVDSVAIGDFLLDNVDSNYVAETLFDGKNQIYGSANGQIHLKTQGYTNEDIIKNLSGSIYFDIIDGRMPKLGSLEYLLRAGNIIKNGITGFTLNSILEILNLVKTGYFTDINGNCEINNGIAENIEIYSQGENLSLYIHGNYDIAKTTAQMEILGKLSKRISTFFGALGNTSLNTFFKLIPGMSLLDFGRKDIVENVEKIPPFTRGNYESRTFQAIIDGDINSSSYVQSFKWVNTK